MSDPRRLLSDPSATPFERDLVESWSAEQPSPAARARALAIAGVAAGTIVAAGTTAAAAGAGTALGAAAPKAAAMGAAALIKWGILGVVLVATAVTGVVLVQSSHPSEATTSSPAGEKNAKTTAQVAATPTATPTPTPTEATTAIEPKTFSPADLPAATPSAARAHATASAPAEPSLAEEIASFERARSALDGGDADRALGFLDAYEKRFPTGTFVQEAEVLRVQALARKGDQAGARRVGQRFLAAHPTSPHAARIRAILDPSNP